jgi:hypothetical protein
MPVGAIGVLLRYLPLRWKSPGFQLLSKAAASGP